MIEGFMGAFIIGFLATAAPRLTGTRHFSPIELLTVLALYTGAVAMHIAEHYFGGDLIFLVLLVTLAALIGRRLYRRTDLPPPSFALVAFGFFNAILGSVLLLLGGAGHGLIRCATLGSLLLYQGFVLYLVLGIGGFLIPRFLTLPAKPELPDSGEFSPPRIRRALFSVAIGMALFAGFVVEVIAEAPRLAAAIRFTAAVVFLGSEIPLHLSAARRVTLSQCFRAAILLLVLGLFFPVLWPWQRVAGIHLIFIGGFTLIAFTVATRVVLGHSGHGDLFLEPLPFLRAAAGLLIAAAGLRVLGDFFLPVRGTLLNSASSLWMVAATIWSWRVLPKIWRSDSESL
jgi:uncharacterized protein involved in response to NO